MEFLHTDSENPASPVDSLRVNWFYRPRDVLRYNNDTRLVYGTMHSDICPLTSLRGKCVIRHRSEVSDLEEFRRNKDSFWYNQVFDRFIHRWYEVIPVSQVINVPEKVKRALDERWNNDSVECAVCHNTYHMNCVRPPLLKKPSRGFAWACGPCGRAQERKLEARRTPLVGEAAASQEEEEMVDEEEEDPGALINTTAPSPNGSDAPVDDHPATQAEIALAKMWPMRYLGIHCRVEDALQYDDRAIYPRASSRLGPRHQANVNVWHGRPVELVKPAEIRKRYNKGPAHKKDPKLSKEDLEADKAEKAKRPKWVQDEPVGYVRRGEDFPNDDPRCTAKTLFKMPPESVRGEDDAPDDREKIIDDYMSKARTEAAKVIGVQEYNTNFLTKAIELLYANNYDSGAALEQLKKINRRKDLREPEPNKEEKKRFEEGVAKYGSELRNVRIHVRTMTHADVVRYYYLWKKTPKGREIWGNYDGRKGKNQKVVADSSTSRLADDIADDVDDSAFDVGKAESRKKHFVCKFCSTKVSRQWRRAPGVAPGQTVPADGRSKDKGTHMIPALCQRCARLWRRYAIKYEDAEELIKKMSAAGGKKWRKLIDQELMNELNAAQNAPPEPIPSIEPADPQAHTTTEPPRKKQKGVADKDSSQHTSAEPPTKKKTTVAPPKPPTPPPQPVMPKMRELPCAVCLQMEPLGDQRLCKNDKKEVVSYTYECVLCPVKETEQELIEPPKVSHKKKSDKEREKERLEKELRMQKLKEYQQHQRDKGRPELPREPLKKTAENNWVHLYCAVWTAELKFTSPSIYELVEGVGTPSIKYDQVCKICKTSKGYIFGFDVTPVKSSRRDAVPTFTLGQETGSLSAAIWCKDHTPKTIVHPLNEPVDENGMTALQLYVQNYKLADQTLTGTARKANLLDQFTKNIAPPAAVTPVNRRTSTVQGGTRSARNSSAGLPKTEEPDEMQNGSIADVKEECKCEICDIEVSPKWWKAEDSQDPAAVPGSNPDQPINTIESTAGSHGAPASHIV
ncbi:putative PHD type zinc finger protein with BAH domain-containing protein [Diplodia seriata]|uniref:PHD type zinc finger protein with BAH domain-containing protein n=1 Tax=Diplodia seriata TaxID=420778 RepID=A0ABR3C9R2_9PEZI